MFFIKAQEKIYLYAQQVPNSRGEGSQKYMDNLPELYYYAAKGVPNQQAILVIPGGGYAQVAMKHEGHDVATLLADQGYAAFVLRYRLPSDDIMERKSIGPLQDAQRAMQLIRTWPGITFTKVGVLGFSAGGHLASTLATHSDQVYIVNKSEVAILPDFTVLCYPVISMDAEITHMGSRNNLLGAHPQDSEIAKYSNELRVNAHTSPTFLMHAKDDHAVKFENALRYQEALNKFEIPNKLFVYEKGGHGFGLINKTSDLRWMDACLAWLSQLPK